MSMKREFKGVAVFNHVDPHMARFVVQPIKDVISFGTLDIKPGMFPEDFEVALYDVLASVTVTVEIKKKK